MSTERNLIIHGQYIKDLSFENPKAPGSFEMENQPVFDMHIDIGATKMGDNLFEVALRLDITANHENDKIFIVSLQYAGLFTVQAQENDELHMVLMVQCPAILFPFARRIVADVTRDGGYPPLSIEPVDFLGLYKNKKELEENKQVVN